MPHTPGPWKVGGEFAGHVVFGPDGDAVAEARGNLGIDPEQPITAEENARLIAAAPRLLAAVEELAAEADKALAYISARAEADREAFNMEGTLMQSIDAARAIAECARGDS